MYTSLDFLVRLNARRFIVVASPELKFRTTDGADTAHVESELPTARKPWYIFSPDFVQTATFLASNASARHCLFWIICHRQFHYSLSFALFCRRVLVRQKKCGTYQCCYKFWLWIFLLCNLFFHNFFVKTFFQHFFFKYFFPSFFS